ncbi:hypothetical protein LTR16_000600 [Cryomyces antarcticus]|uniref:Uncharacterized protein n=1 Tax=Cryomyces antarcticus TaxID=329879 RepID=A0ABR0MAU1_9PEZI|nr:hypothetical protein LTR60_001675 [Cryomyces antarcticus]KAK5019830.1 hypothetical protein LTR39_000116 [Cryomyces antarcticus]KAK5296603.1 hypothetical protein LTR16_000600 [Cryomyces antarcticus]
MPIKSGTKPWPEVPVGNKVLATSNPSALGLPIWIVMHFLTANYQDHTNATVLIIGAGISGMCTAIDLIKRNKCHNFIIVEKSSGVGGTWHDNKYPGCCCDVWSRLYSYSFEQNPDWTREYPGQEEILDYLLNIANKYHLYKYIRFNTSVSEARWDDVEKKWKTVVKVSGTKDAEYSPEYTITSDYFVSAVGQLNVPNYPKIPGLETFKGKTMHSARWDWSYNLDGKKIAVIGNGATAAQIIPEIAKTASHITVYQRTPNWIIPRGDAPVSPMKRALFKYVPPLRWRARAMQMDFRESFYDAVINGQSPFAGDIRTWCEHQMHEALPDQPELWEKLTPKYNPGCKRIIISDDYYPTLARKNVTLETRPISRITENGIDLKGEDGQPAPGESDFDLLVLATGFRTVEFMYPIDITGANGKSIKDIWRGGARAYYGTTVTDLPNFGMLYGPNTNLGHNSIILMIEAQSRYINALIAPVLDARRNGKNLALKPKPDVVDAYNDKVQQILNNSSFADPNCNSWYKNDEGRITNNWSGTVIEYQENLATVDWTDYIAEGTGTDVLEGKTKSNIGRVVEETQFSNTTLAFSVLSAAIVAGGFLARNSRYLNGLRLR